MSFNEVAALVSVPADLMIDIYKAFILPHLEYCAPVLVVNLLSSGLCNKLELTNQFAIRTLMNLPKSTPYGEPLKIVNEVPRTSQIYASLNPSL